MTHYVYRKHNIHRNHQAPRCLKAPATRLFRQNCITGSLWRETKAGEFPHKDPQYGKILHVMASSCNTYLPFICHIFIDHRDSMKFFGMELRIRWMDVCFSIVKYVKCYRWGHLRRHKRCKSPDFCGKSADHSVSCFRGNYRTTKWYSLCDKSI